MTGTPSDLYDQDFYAWANEQETLLRAGKLSAADIDHIAEETESIGKTEKRELISRLTVLLQHLLKWRYQPFQNHRDGISARQNRGKRRNGSAGGGGIFRKPVLGPSIS